MTQQEGRQRHAHDARHAVDVAPVRPPLQLHPAGGPSVRPVQRAGDDVAGVEHEDCQSERGPAAENGE